MSPGAVESLHHYESNVASIHTAQYSKKNNIKPVLLCSTDPALIDFYKGLISENWRGRVDLVVLSFHGGLRQS